MGHIIKYRDERIIMLVESKHPGWKETFYRKHLPISRPYADISSEEEWHWFGSYRSEEHQATSPQRYSDPDIGTSLTEVNWLVLVTI